jgi:Ca2+-binding EF-hand superfamily protein
MFPFIQPEHLRFEYDISFNDQRIATLILFKICAAEKASNFKDITFTPKNDSPMDETNFWRSFKELSTEKMPACGIFKGLYICAPEDRNFKARIKLLETYGFWQANVREVDVRWWASLFEAPGDVLEFVEWLLPRYPDLSKAFYAIDGSVPGASVSNGQITLKEFEGGLEALKCKKFAGPGEKQSILTVFRFLDPTGEGTISEGEWSMLGLLWKEIQLSMLQFVKFLERTVGPTLQDWWKSLDLDGSGEISFSEWRDICRNLGFFGATRQIFKFIDKDDEGNISFEEFEVLELFRNGFSL